jgi:hypothetical protein
VIHLISSKQHYAFNLAWLEETGSRKQGSAQAAQGQ